MFYYWRQFRVCRVRIWDFSIHSILFKYQLDCFAFFCCPEVLFLASTLFFFLCEKVNSAKKVSVFLSRIWYAGWSVNFFSNIFVFSGRNATTRNSQEKRNRKKSQLALKYNSQYTHRRSRANVLWACQQRVGFYTKFRVGIAVKRRRVPTGDFKPRI